MSHYLFGEYSTLRNSIQGLCIRFKEVDHQCRYDRTNMQVMLKPLSIRSTVEGGSFMNTIALL